MRRVSTSCPVDSGQLNEASEDLGYHSKRGEAYVYKEVAVVVPVIGHEGVVDD